MNVSFDRIEGSDEWYTPLSIVNSLGEFDLDPCAPPPPIIWKTAKESYNKYDDGLSREWFGRVWLNPPYSKPLITRFFDRMASHGNGIALTFNRMDSALYQDHIFPFCTALFVLSKRIRFHDSSLNVPSQNPGCGSVLIAYGEENVRAIIDSGMKGVMLRVEYEQRRDRRNPELFTEL